MHERDLLDRIGIDFEALDRERERDEEAERKALEKALRNARVAPFDWDAFWEDVDPEA